MLIVIKSSYIHCRQSRLQNKESVDATKNRLSKYMKQNLIEPQGEIDESTVIVGNFNTHLSEMDKYIRQKISKDIINLNITISQQDILDICRLHHPTTAENTFL